MLQALTCKLNIRHEWHTEHAEDGSLYKRCLRCGHQDSGRGSDRIPVAQRADQITAEALRRVPRLNVGKHQGPRPGEQFQQRNSAVIEAVGVR